MAGDLGHPDGLTAGFIWFIGVERVFLLSAGPTEPTHDANVVDAARPLAPAT